MLTHLLMALSGLAAGSLIVWLVLRAQSARITERLSGKVSELDEARKLLDEAAQDRQTLRAQLQAELALRSTAEERAGRVSDLESEAEKLQQQILMLHEEASTLRAKLSESETRREEEQKAMESKLMLLNDARQEFGIQFKQLANQILEENTEKLNERSTSNLSTVIAPLGERIKEFQKKVEDVYNIEARERFSLEKEVRRLAELNVQVSQDAVNLTNALKGQTKVQGDLAEVILESVLEKSGLVKGREYLVQKSLTDEGGRRSRPDVIVLLPDQRHLVIDSKVNLPTYQEYCNLNDGPERALILKRHITAFRRHVSDLNLKRYQDHYKLNSLDFVLMFIPFEGAFSIALQSDNGLFNDAFEKNIIIVTPFTLGATIRTVANVWQREYQGRNALKIATQAGRLYDKFVAFVSDLEEVGTKLHGAQASYDNAHNKLVLGRGNIISRVENIRKLGARTKKAMPQNLIDDSAEDNGNERPQVGPVVDALRPSVTDELGALSSIDTEQTNEGEFSLANHASRQ